MKLCNVEHCDGEVDFNIKAQANGLHKLHVDFLEGTIVIEKAFAINDDITFPVNQLNDNFHYIAKLYQPDGQQITVSKDEVVYDCFSFGVVRKNTITISEQIPT